jgi:hypothetical protein
MDACRAHCHSLPLEPRAAGAERSGGGGAGGGGGERVERGVFVGLAGRRLSGRTAGCEQRRQLRGVGRRILAQQHLDGPAPHALEDAGGLVGDLVHLLHLTLVCRTQAHASEALAPSSNPRIETTGHMMTQCLHRAM